MSAVIHRSSPSLSDIEPSWGMEFEPYVVRGVMSRPLDGCGGVALSASKTRRLIAYLVENDQQARLERSLQGLCETAGGQTLLTAIMNPYECQRLCSALNFLNLRMAIATWIGDGCNEVALHFLDGRA